MAVWQILPRRETTLLPRSSFALNGLNPAFATPRTALMLITRVIEGPRHPQPSQLRVVAEAEVEEAGAAGRQPSLRDEVEAGAVLQKVAEEVKEKTRL